MHIIMAFEAWVCRPLQSISFVKLTDLFNWQTHEISFTAQQPLLHFTTRMNASIPPNATQTPQTHAWLSLPRLRRSRGIYYVGLWPRWCWEISNCLNHCRDVQGRDDFTRKLLFLKEWSIVQYCQTAYCDHRLLNHLKLSPNSRYYSWGHRMWPAHLLQVSCSPSEIPNHGTSSVAGRVRPLQQCNLPSSHYYWWPWWTFRPKGLVKYNRSSSQFPATAPAPIDFFNC